MGKPEYEAAYYQANKEKIRIRNKIRRNNSPQEQQAFRDRAKRYKLKYREKDLAYKRQYNKLGWPKKKEARRIITQFLWDYKLSHPCVECKESDPILLEFDHVRGEKKFHISRSTEYAMATVLLELAKCEVRCVACHRRKTFFEAKMWKNLRQDQYPDESAIRSNNSFMGMMG